MCSRRTLWLFLLFVIPLHGQQVQRATVAFEKYFYEVDASQPHIKMFFTCGPQEEYEIEVFYETIDGTALAGRDYVETKGSFIFPAGSPTRTREIQIQLLPREPAGDRTFSVKLTGTFPAEVSRSRGHVNVTIADLPEITTLRYQTNLVLYWRASATNYVLQRCESLLGNWTPVSESPRPVGQDDPRQVLSIPINTSANQFFRLRAPAAQ